MKADQEVGAPVLSAKSRVLLEAWLGVGSTARVSEKATPRADEITGAHAVAYKRFIPQNARARWLEGVSLTDVPGHDIEVSIFEAWLQVVVQQVFEFQERRA